MFDLVASALLDGGFRAGGYQTVQTKREEDDEEDVLDVDGDDTAVLGKPQFTEADILRAIPHVGINEMEQLPASDEVVDVENSGSVLDALKLRIQDLVRNKEHGITYYIKS